MPAENAGDATEDTRAVEYQEAQIIFALEQADRADTRPAQLAPRHAERRRRTAALPDARLRHLEDVADHRGRRRHHPRSLSDVHRRPERLSLYVHGVEGTADVGEKTRAGDHRRVNASLD